MEHAHLQRASLCQQPTAQRPQLEQLQHKHLGQKHCLCSPQTPVSAYSQHRMVRVACSLAISQGMLRRKGPGTAVSLRRLPQQGLPDAWKPEGGPTAGCIHIAIWVSRFACMHEITSAYHYMA